MSLLFAPPPRASLSAQGLFDFFYLPIDFKNNCNKGYAFINMIDPKSILSLHMNFNGHRWKHFKSEKVCAITYARIQGKQHMIDRFQVSDIVARSPLSPLPALPTHMHTNAANLSCADARAAEFVRDEDGLKLATAYLPLRWPEQG